MWGALEVAMTTGFEPVRSGRIQQIRSPEALLHELLRWNPDVQSAVLVQEGRALVSAAAAPSVVAAAESTASIVSAFFGATARLGLQAIRMTTVEGEDGRAIVARVDDATVLVVIATHDAAMAALRSDVEWVATRFLRERDAVPA
jgi:predicted regulator of Ras-like GTPase activity (Roadblock/LC7/MglB family)